MPGSNVSRESFSPSPVGIRSHALLASCTALLMPTSSKKVSHPSRPISFVACPCTFFHARVIVPYFRVNRLRISSRARLAGRFARSWAACSAPTATPSACSSSWDLCCRRRRRDCVARMASSATSRSISERRTSPVRFGSRNSRSRKIPSVALISWHSSRKSSRPMIPTPSVSQASKASCRLPNRCSHKSLNFSSIAGVRESSCSSAICSVSFDMHAWKIFSALSLRACSPLPSVCPARFSPFMSWSTFSMANLSSGSNAKRHALATLPNLSVKPRMKFSLASVTSFLLLHSSSVLFRTESCLASSSLTGGMSTWAIRCSSWACLLSRYFLRNCGTAFSSLFCSLRIRRVRVFT
mmetsp:Transcript_66843/g.157474  ORF Transcript_66843/g.157474 Transcript_66843/m.157474 type:complete len:354 (-) Transcript_66843:1169-2230(-)